MGTTSELRWGRMALRTERLDPHTRRTTIIEPTIELYAYTASEQARVITLTEREALQLAHELIDAIIKARQIRAVRADRERRARLHAASEQS